VGALFLCPKGGTDHMKTYNVRIRETLEMIVPVEAESMTQAKEIVEDKWKNSEYILDASHFQKVAFETLYPRNRDYER
jgi:hypothetical protein